MKMCCNLCLVMMDQRLTTSQILVDRVTHTYKTETGDLPVLDDLTIEIKKHRFTAVVGPSGCGKSTLTRLIAGLLMPDEGAVWLNGDKVSSPRSSVGMAFQNPVLLEWRTVLKNVNLPLEIIQAKARAPIPADKGRELLELVGLAGFEDKRPSELSGGMKQRASLCRALVHNPEVLILDEPFAALDAFTREDLWLTMLRLRDQEPFTGVLITHDLREAIFLADEVIVLSGRPATNQYALDLADFKISTLDDLYTHDAMDILNVLRGQIKQASENGIAVR